MRPCTRSLWNNIHIVGTVPSDNCRYVGTIPSDNCRYVGAVLSDNCRYVGAVLSDNCRHVGAVPSDNCRHVGAVPSDNCRHVGAGFFTAQITLRATLRQTRLLNERYLTACLSIASCRRHGWGDDVWISFGHAD